MNKQARFWNLILEDHLFFIHDALAKDEVKYINRVKDIYKMETNDMNTFITEIIDLKKNILADQLQGKVQIKLPATFLNHMLNEAELAVEELTGNLRIPLENDKLWLLDAEGHLVTIMKHLDPTEKILKQALKKECRAFHDLFCNALEFIGYLRSGIDTFPAKEKLNTDIKQSLDVYFELLTLIADLLTTNSCLTTLHPLMVDHMLREQSYYALSRGETPKVDPFERGVKHPFE